MKNIGLFDGIFKKARSGGGGARKAGCNAGEIGEYDFFVPQDREKKGDLSPRDESAKRNSDKSVPDKGMTFFLWE